MRLSKLRECLTDSFKQYIDEETVEKEVDKAIDIFENDLMRELEKDKDHWEDKRRKEEQWLTDVEKGYTAGRIDQIDRVYTIVGLSKF